MIGNVARRSAELLGSEWQGLAGMALAIGAFNALVGLVYGLGLGQLQDEPITEDTISGAYAVWALVGSMLVLGVSLVFSAVLISMVAEASRGDRPDAGAALTGVLRQFLPLLATVFLATVAVTIGIFLFVIPGIWIGVSFTPLVAVFLAEEHGVVGSLRRSFQLVRGNWWQVFAIVLILGAINIALSVIGVVPGTIGFLVDVVINAVNALLMATAIWFVYEETKRATDWA